jgi:hypothetical protein
MKVRRIIVLLGCSMCFATLGVSQNLCTCYLPSDCKGRNAVCGLGGSCLPQGKKDGKCEVPASPPSAVAAGATVTTNTELVATDRLAMSSAIDAYFRSFIKAVEKGGGHPDSDLLATAQNVRLSQAQHSIVEEAVWVSLDAVMGWDFQYPTDMQKIEGFVGNVREVHGVTAADRSSMRRGKGCSRP